MASGETTTGGLAAALPSIIGSARLVHEFTGTWMRTTDVQRQGQGEGLNWQEYSLDQKTAQAISETTENNNNAQISGSLLQTEPTMTQIIMKITDRTFRKLAKIVSGQFGALAGNAMARLKDEDYLALFSGFGTGTSPGAGNPLSFGHIAAAKQNITSNVTEPSNAQVFTVLHGFQIKDIQDEVNAGVGTYTIPEGLTAETFKQGFSGSVAGSNLFEDGNITIDSGADAIGATHSREAVVAAIGMEIKKETDRDLRFGGGADVVSLVDEYSFVERSAGNWALQHKSDATAPTS